jgi:hypothetical protein
MAVVHTWLLGSLLCAITSYSERKNIQNPRVAMDHFGSQALATLKTPYSKEKATQSPRVARDHFSSTGDLENQVLPALTVTSFVVPTKKSQRH